MITPELIRLAESVEDTLWAVDEARGKDKPIEHLVFDVPDVEGYVHGIFTGVEGGATAVQILYGKGAENDVEALLDFVMYERPLTAEPQANFLTASLVSRDQLPAPLRKLADALAARGKRRLFVPALFANSARTMVREAGLKDLVTIQFVLNGYLAAAKAGWLDEEGLGMPLDTEAFELCGPSTNPTIDRVSRTLLPPTAMAGGPVNLDVALEVADIDAIAVALMRALDRLRVAVQRAPHWDNDAAIESFFGDAETGSRILDEHAAHGSPLDYFLWCASELRDSETGRTPIEEALEDPMSRLERDCLEVWSKAPISLYYATPAERGAIRLEDRLSDERLLIPCTGHTVPPTLGPTYNIGKAFRIGRTAYLASFSPPIPELAWKAAESFLDMQGLELTRGELARRSHLIGRLWVLMDTLMAIAQADGFSMPPARRAKGSRSKPKKGSRAKRPPRR